MFFLIGFTVTIVEPSVIVLTGQIGTTSNCAVSSSMVLYVISTGMGFLVTVAILRIVLGYQVEQPLSGFIRKSLVVYTASFGVAILVSIGMMRVVWDIPLLYIIVPGYFMAFIMLLLSDKDFVAIVFDSGAAATGAMVVTFLTALALGASTVKTGSDSMIDGFGLISLMALAPALSVMLLGLLFHSKLRSKEVKK